MTERHARTRRAGTLVPLFSVPSTGSWGIGEISDLPVLAGWAREAGLSAVQLLPVNEMADGQSSPYSALSAMAIDPIFISIGGVPGFAAAGGEAALSPAQREQLDEARRSPAVDHSLVRDLKTGVLRGLFERFLEEQWRPARAGAAAMREYAAREAWWLEDYSLFRALHARHDGRYWLDWEPGLRSRDPRALGQARRNLEHEIVYYAWLQWIAGVQWASARSAASGIAILGDFPFMVSGDSADVWARQREFRLDASVGVPPDAFSETGQDWGLPVYRWDVHAATKYEWLRQRVRRCFELFDGFRVDHLVGFYRTFVREPDGSTAFVPPDEASQCAQGERLLTHFEEGCDWIIAEDLGVIPDFVRASLTRLEIPGMKVMRWERDWAVPTHPFKDPAAYPPVSVAISGTHDTETMAEWWDNAPPEERALVAALPVLIRAGIRADEPYSGRVRDALLEALYSSGSDLLLLPMQDIFGWRDRINTPAVVSDENWSWRLPWPVDTLADQPQARERAAFLRRLGRASSRS